VDCTIVLRALYKLLYFYPLIAAVYLIADTYPVITPQHEFKLIAQSTWYAGRTLQSIHTGAMNSNVTLCNALGPISQIV
jgi:hypothetical protein